MLFKRKNKEQYPAAVLLQEACYRDYEGLIDRYSKIYDRINIVLGVCGVLLFAVLDTFSFEDILNIKARCAKENPLLVIAPVAFSALSALFLIGTLIKLLCLVRSNSLRAFDSLPIRNKKLYFLTPDQAALWLILSYTNAIANLKDVVAKKQNELNTSIVLLVVSILCYAVASILFEKVG